MNFEELSREELIVLAKKAVRQREITESFQENNQAYRLYHACKSNAKRKNIPFSIEISDIVIPEVCPIMGCKITNYYKQGRVKTNASVDRITPELGYVKGNIRVISDLANRMKQDATDYELYCFAKGILELYGHDQ